jgi:hypothetical protein
MVKERRGVVVAVEVTAGSGVVEPAGVVRDVRIRAADVVGVAGGSVEAVAARAARPIANPPATIGSSGRRLDRRWRPRVRTGAN